MALKVLSLFSGIGAFEKALDRCGVDYELVNYCEIDKYASKSYAAVHNVSEELNLGDITKVDTSKLPHDIDLITHGSPCFLAGEQVNTINGFKNIEDIKVGDYVKSHNGTYNKVIETMENQNNCIYDIKCGATHLINTTFNHPFYISRNGEKQWVEAKGLTTNDFMLIPINKCQNQIEWEGTKLYYNRHTEVSNKLPFNDNRFWYLIGRFIGNGWVVKRTERNGNISGIKICCGKHEIESLKDKIGDVFNYYLSEESTVYKLQFTNKELGEFCNQFGVGATNKQIPQSILDLKNEYLQSLLEGILDSDGCFDGIKYKLTSVSKKLVYNVGELVLKLYKVPYHIYKTNRPNKYEIDGRKVNQKNTYTIYWQLENFNKKNNYVDDDYFYSRIRKINTRIELSDVYNIEVENTHSYCVNNIATHNCQDFSSAGRQAGGDEGSGTRSSLMYETIRIVRDIKPKFIIWENVKNVLSAKHVHNFNLYIDTLKEFGYNSYHKVLNAKDFGVPQNRERIFVISVREDVDSGMFEFPKPKELTVRLRDVLEGQVDEKYYLSQKILDRFQITDPTFTKSIVGTTKPDFRTIGQRDVVYQEDGIMGSLVATDYKQPKQVVVRLGGVFDTEKSRHQAGSVYDVDGLSPTLDTAQGGWRQPCIIDEVEEVKTGLFDHTSSDNFARGKRDYGYRDEYGILKCTPKYSVYKSTDLRIRKLTPLECWRLMGFDDEDLEKAAKINSNTQLYKQAGNSIVVNVLEAIFKKLGEVHEEFKSVEDEMLLNCG